MFSILFCSIQVFEKLTGVTVAAPKAPLPIQGGASIDSCKVTIFEKLEKDSTLQALPKEWPEDVVEEVVKTLMAKG